MEINKQLDQLLSSISSFQPELFLSTMFVILIISELIFFKKLTPKDADFWIKTIVFIVLTISFFQIVNQFFDFKEGFLFNKMLFLDLKAIFFKGLIALSSIMLILHSIVLKKQWKGEFYTLLIGAILGLYLLTMSVNLMMVYLSLEIVSIASYIFTLLEKEKKASEGAIKYILFGAVASAIMLYGMSLLYGITGTLLFVSPEFSRGLLLVDPIVTTIAVLLTLVGFLFKLSLAPFHLWTPDVYQTAPTPVVSFFSIAPKVAVFLVLMRFVGQINIDLQSIFAILSILTITLGNFSAIWQNNTKRLLAYSSIAHAGFLLIGIISQSRAGNEATVFYMCTYLFANFLAFFLIDIVASQNSKTSNENRLEDLKGLGLKKPLFGIIMLFAMISLAGLPPTIGFIAKLNIFTSLWEATQKSNDILLMVLFVFGLMNTAVALFYYLKIPYYLFFKKQDENQTIDISLSQTITMLLFVAPLVWLLFKPNWLLNIIHSL